MTGRTATAPLRRDALLLVSVGTCVVFLVFGDTIWNRAEGSLLLVAVFAWLFATVLASAIAVVRQAEALAERLGDPYGTLILTISVTVIEVTSIAAVMLHGDPNPTLARDTLLAVVMIILNGMVGLSLLIGGWRHREQYHNLQGANVYLGATIPLTVLALVLPDYTRTTPGATLSTLQELFLIVVSLGLYATFLVLQTGRHSRYFMADGAGGSAAPPDMRPSARRDRSRGTLRPTLMLVAYLLPALFLAQQLAHPVDYLIETLHAPAPLGGVILGVLVATPEAIGAVRAALANQLQRAVNIFMGSVLSTIGITIPAIVLISEFTHQTLVLGVQHTDLVLLLLTLTTTIVTFASGRTNAFQGLVHLMLFAAYLLLIFQD